MASTTASTSTSISSSRMLKSMQSAGQASTQAWHSEHTPQSRQRAAPRKASSSVIGASVSVKSVGAALITACDSNGSRRS